MSSLGLAFNGEDTLSAARLNQKTIFVGTGTQIAGLAPTYPGQIVVCTATGSGFVIDTVYYRDSTNSSWKYLSMSKHLHDSDTDLSGGLLRDIIYANMANNNTIDYHMFKKEYMHQTGSGGSVTTDLTSSSGKVIIDSSAIANNYMHLVDYGLKFGFDAKSRLSIKMGLNADTNLITRISVAGEDVNSANTTTRKYGIEGCDSTGTNWNIFSANGTTRSGAIDTGSPLNAGYDTTGKHYRIDHTPNVDIKFYNNGVNCGANCTKTSFVPNDGDTGTDYVLRLGIKTTNGASKKIAIWGLIAQGKISDSVWF